MLTNNKSGFTILVIAIILVLSIIIVYRAVFDNESKSRIISQFENNSDKFVLIQKYAEETKGNLFVVYDSGKLEIKNSEGRNGVFDEKAEEEIIFVTKKLGFVSIYETDKYIVFQRSIGKYPKGIIYLKEESMPAFVLESQKINDKWFYYMTKNV